MKLKNQITSPIKLRYLAYLVLVTAVITSTTLARFAANVDVGATSGIAAFVSGTEVTLELGTQGPLSPGETQKIEFRVSNTENGKTCEVPLDYEIQVETTGNLPLSFELVSGSVIDEEMEDNAAVGSLDQTLNATGGKLPSARTGGAVTHAYTLEITWPRDENAEEYSHEIDRLAVVVTTEQHGNKK